VFPIGGTLCKTPPRQLLTQLLSNGNEQQQMRLPKSRLDKEGAQTSVNGIKQKPDQIRDDDAFDKSGSH